MVRRSPVSRGPGLARCVTRAFNLFPSTHPDRGRWVISDRPARQPPIAELTPTAEVSPQGPGIQVVRG